MFPGFLVNWVHKKKTDQRHSLLNIFWSNTNNKAMFHDRKWWALADTESYMVM